jgi:pimeloyl-ACP methyl ester carboxylesterase
MSWSRTSIISGPRRVLRTAASRFGQFTAAVLVLWGEADPFFRTELGRQLAEALPHATVPGGRTFLPLDHPGEVAHEITAAMPRVPRLIVRSVRTDDDTGPALPLLVAAWSGG